MWARLSTLIHNVQLFSFFLKQEFWVPLISIPGLHIDLDQLKNEGTPLFAPVRTSGSSSFCTSFFFSLNRCPKLESVITLITQILFMFLHYQKFEAWHACSSLYSPHNHVEYSVMRVEMNGEDDQEHLSLVQDGDKMTEKMKNKLVFLQASPVRRLLVEAVHLKMHACTRSTKELEYP